MRLLFILTFCLFSISVYADGSDDFPPPPTNPMPSSISPQGNLAGSGSTPNTSTTGTTGTDTFGAIVQQNTSQAMQVFQNVNYQKLSGAENQGDFGSDGDSGGGSSSNSNTTQPFNLFQGNP